MSTNTDTYAYDETIGKLEAILKNHRANIQSKLVNLNTTKDSNVLSSIITSFGEAEKQINQLINDINATKMPQLSEIVKKINVEIENYKTQLENYKTQFDNYKNEFDKTMNNLTDKKNLTPDSFNKILSELKTYIRDFSTDFKKITDDVKLLKREFKNKVAPENNPYVEVKTASFFETLKSSTPTINFQNCILFFIGIAIVIIVALSLTLKYDKNISSSSKSKTIMALSCFVFVVIVIGYIYYLNNVIGNTTEINAEKLLALRNTNIVYLMILLASLFVFYAGGYQNLMRDYPEKTMITTSIMGFLYLMYARRYNYQNISSEFFKVLGGLLMIALFTYNPYNIMPKLSGVNVAFIMMAIIFFIVMITYYNDIYTDANIFTFLNVNDGLKKFFLIIFSIIISIGVIVVILSSFNAFDNHTTTSGNYLLNVAIVVGMLGVLYKVLDSTGFLQKHPVARLVVACALYIPCLFTNILETILKEYYQTTNFTVVLLAIETVLIVISIYYPKILALLYTSDGGMIVVNEPTDLSKQHIVSYYETLSGNNIVDLIKNPNLPDIKVGNEVQVKQKGDSFYKGVIKKIHKDKQRDLYDICYIDDKTYQYNVPKSEIKTSGKLTLGIDVDVTKRWLAGTILNTNFDGSFNIKYKTDLTEEQKRALEITMVEKNVDPKNIMMVNEINPDKKAYRFALSFWVFINSMPPNTNENYNKYTSLLNYSNNPNVLYNPSANDFIVSVNQNIESPNPSANINNDSNQDVYNIIYSNKNMPLQKWNNIVINYDSGTMDIFLNGVLVQSSNNIVPNVTYHELTIGSDKGIKAGLCNLVYFREPVNIITINNLYNMSKSRDPPNVPDKNLFSF